MASSSLQRSRPPCASRTVSSKLLIWFPPIGFRRRPACLPSSPARRSPPSTTVLVSLRPGGRRSHLPPHSPSSQSWIDCKTPTSVSSSRRESPRAVYGTRPRRCCYSPPLPGVKCCSPPCRARMGSGALSFRSGAVAWPACHGPATPGTVASDKPGTRRGCAVIQSLGAIPAKAKNVGGAAVCLCIASVGRDRPHLPLSAARSPNTRTSELARLAGRIARGWTSYVRASRRTRRLPAARR